MAGRKGRRGWGWLRQTTAGRWHASYIGPDEARHNAPSTFDTKLDGEYWLAGERRLIAMGDWTPPKSRARRGVAGPTLAEYAPRVLDRRRVRGRPLKPRTRAHYDSLLRRVILPELGGVRVNELTEERVSQWFDDLDPDHETQRAHAYALLRVIMNAAVADKGIPEVKVNPCTVSGAGQSTGRRRRIEPASLTELEALAAATPERLRLMPLLAAWCSLRFGEVAELRRGDVDTVAGVLHISRALSRIDRQNIVGTPKSDAGARTVAIPPHLLPAIVEHLGRFVGPESGALLFPHSLEEPARHFTHGYYYKAVHVPAREAAGRPDLRFHDLRHTGATLAAQTGATLAELMARLGHSTPGAALRYQHAALGRDRQIAAALSRMAEGAR